MYSPGCRSPEGATKPWVARPKAWPKNKIIEACKADTGNLPPPLENCRVDAIL